MMLKSNIISHLLLCNQHSKSIDQVMIAIELQILLPFKHLLQQQIMNLGNVRAMSPSFICKILMSEKTRRPYLSNRNASVFKNKLTT